MDYACSVASSSMLPPRGLEDDQSIEFVRAYAHDFEASRVNTPLSNERRNHDDDDTDDYDVSDDTGYDSTRREGTAGVVQWTRGNLLGQGAFGKVSFNESMNE